ncbi:biotin/lipoyl-binding protein [Solobacterium sp.]|uniref:biotin/lipoyl-binding protein n=1 Tax=Solobacterium sp. TaxID=2060878 RepID=UPI001CAD9AB6|nr:biotin/lipoyl-binding protein [Solobacterium sp.]MBF1098771.1 efflux RND transporter periplasmic adaptor subunit [Solobacterium sp.]
MNKKRVIISVSVVAALVIGYFGILQYRKASRKVDVVQVSTMNMGGNPMESQMSGLVSDPATQTVTPSSSQIISAVYVTEGQAVSVGDKLLAYDITSLNYTVELKKIEISTTQLRLEQAKKELQQLQNTKPIERKVAPTPTPTPEPEFKLDTEVGTQVEDNKVWNYLNSLTDEDTEFTKDLDEPTPTPTPQTSPVPTPTPAPMPTPTPVAPAVNTYEKGTKANPYHFAIKGDGFLTGKFVKELIQKAETDGKTFYVSLDVYKDDDKTKGLVDSWLVSIDRLKEILGTETNDLAKVDLKTRTLLKVQVFHEDPVPEIEPDGMTASELVRAIHAKESEVREYDIDIRRKQLELSELQTQLADGVVYAKRSGVIKGLKDINNVPTDGTPFLTVAGGTGTEVKGTISELLLTTIQKGTKVSVTSYETGSIYEAVVTQIDNFPTNSGEGFYGGNPNVSMYGFTAYIEKGDDLKQGTYLSLSIQQENMDTSSIYLSNAFIRDEHGQKYVMKDVDGKLVKTYIKTGKVYFNMSTEVLSGLADTDYIAFPYGDGAIEGTRTKIDMDDNAMLGGY